MTDKPMTVGELRNRIKHIPDDVEVSLISPCSNMVSVGDISIQSGYDYSSVENCTNKPVSKIFIWSNLWRHRR
jgi:hypothetical protein